MSYEIEEQMPSPIGGITKKPEIQMVLEEIGISTETLHKTIEQLTVRLNPIIKEEIESKEAERHPPFITKLAQEFDDQNEGIKLATKKLRKLINRLEI